MKPLLLFLLLWSALAQAAAPPDLDAWVERAMKAFEVPGAAVAIVKDGRVEAARGYGVRRLGAPAAWTQTPSSASPPTPRPSPPPPSLSWWKRRSSPGTTPSRKHLPAFQLYDPYASREATVRDLLCHRTGLGLGAGDLLFWPDTDVTRAQVVAAARFIRPASSFRSRYAYNNLTFVVAGEVVAAVAGKSWDDFVRERILVPVGMDRSAITSPRMDANAASRTRAAGAWKANSPPFRPPATIPGPPPPASNPAPPTWRNGWPCSSTAAGFRAASASGAMPPPGRCGRPTRFSPSASRPSTP
jgi:CubicO group peptidase (beta-lactamase class C family)